MIPVGRAGIDNHWMVLCLCVSFFKIIIQELCSCLDSFLFCYNLFIINVDVEQYLLFGHLIEVEFRIIKCLEHILLFVVCRGRSLLFQRLVVESKNIANFLEINFLHISTHYEISIWRCVNIRPARK